MASPGNEHCSASCIGTLSFPMGDANMPQSDSQGGSIGGRSLLSTIALLLCCSVVRDGDVQVVGRRWPDGPRAVPAELRHEEPVQGVPAAAGARRRAGRGGGRPGAPAAVDAEAAATTWV